MARGAVKNSSPLSSAVTDCKGVGPKTAATLLRLGITSIEQLLHHYPRAYLDRRNLCPIASIERPGPVVIQGEITGIRSFRSSRRLHITQCTVRDATGSMKAIWFNRPYLKKALPKGTTAILSGSVSDRRGLQLENADMEMPADSEKDSLHTLGLIPVYPLTQGIGQKKVRRIVRAALDEFLELAPENLPLQLIEGEGLLSRREALRGIHFPLSDGEPEKARRRLAFEEFLALQLWLQSSTASHTGAGVTHDAPPDLTRSVDERLPFRPTPSQRLAIDRIASLMESPRQMCALLQGDVGSGKTIVAVYAMLKAIENDRQAILMAPTEILAEQHIFGLHGSVRSLLDKRGIETGLLSSGRSPGERKRASRLLASGEPALIVGTHALIEKKVRIRNAGLIVIDEQHRFGVSQRAALRDKGVNADLLIMTATPIPRTLALALYGGFETIRIDELPPGRRPVETRRMEEEERERMYRFVEREINRGRQAFVVCPEIDEHLEPTGRAVANTGSVYRAYADRFPGLAIGVLHGRVAPEEREDTLRRFRRNKIHILVATTIIEVGVDVPNAAVIVIEDADRFGLAQLHQLRGRVGRSEHKSYCFLMAESTTEEAARRMEIMASASDGFKISEEDMLLRGAGEFLGTAQSGAPPLRAGHLIRDAILLERAGQVAREILEEDPGLESSENMSLRLLLGGGPGDVHF